MPFQLLLLVQRYSQALTMGRWRVALSGIGTGKDD